MKRKKNNPLIVGLIIISMASASMKVMSQDLRFGVYFDPMITWMNTNSPEYNNEGVKPGFGFGLTALKYFDENYAISSGISLITASGRISAVDPHEMVFNNTNPDVPAGYEMIYNLHYLNIPAGLHLNTNQIGYVTLFTDLGVDLRILLRSSADIPRLDIFNEIAKNEVYGMNLGWHINAGIEYSLGGSTALVAGLGFDEDFFDITKDLADAAQPEDRSGLRIIRIKLGIMF